jgi:hypothetical protein
MFAKFSHHADEIYSKLVFYTVFWRGRSMVTEQVFYWQIQWAGRWMLTRQRFSECKIREDHPEAIRVDGSEETVLTPETPQERQYATAMSRTAIPGVRYNLA